MDPSSRSLPLTVDHLTKRYGRQVAVDDVTFSIGAGRVTGFLGPNGAGKTTTLRMVVGLTTPSSGEALVFGSRYRDLGAPTRLVGTLIDASGMHPGRRARQELRIRAAAIGVDDARVPVVLAEVGLEAAADKRVGQLSLGMRQRLGLAAALLGHPQLLILDEPANGLDPSGIHWLRSLLRQYAANGTSVLVSSHVLAELAQFADDVVVLDHGRLVLQSSVQHLVGTHGQRVFVRSPKESALREVLAPTGAELSPWEDGLMVSGLTAEEVGDAAAMGAIPLHQLRTEIRTLEEAFLALTDGQEGIR